MGIEVKLEVFQGPLDLLLHPFSADFRGRCLFFPFK